MPLVAAFATSHAYTFQEPETWDTRRERSIMREDIPRFRKIVQDIGIQPE